MKNQVMENIAVVARKKTPKALMAAKDLCQWIDAKGLKVFVQDQSDLKNLGQIMTAENLDSVDLVVALGGDGTYLEAFRLLKGRPTPILGVNLGSLGFLTENRLETMKTTLEATLSNDLEKRPRSVLSLDVEGISPEILALNDVVVERGDRTHLINLAIYCNNALVMETKADGVVVATPTGSTAYNLASGGPILHPEVGAFVVTPICPHSLTSRPLLFPDDLELQIRILGNDRDAQLTVDGVKVAEISDKNPLTLKKHKWDHQVIRHPSHNFFNLLREKLKFGERD